MNSDLEALFGSDRAEDLNPEQIISLFSEAGGDGAIVDRLVTPGVFLLQGGRGTGKTMLMRVAYERMRATAIVTKTVPVFLSFSRYLATYNANSNPTKGYHPFQNWVFAKMVGALRDAAADIQPDQSTTEIDFGQVPLREYTSHLESHYHDPSVADPRENAERLGIEEIELLNFARLDLVQSRILGFLDRLNFSSVAFFLDEAAQNFAEELQPEFFQLIKHLRHFRISVKAAVYPNTTNFGRDFDIGHDAIVIPLERQIENSEGMALFRDLVKKRFGGTQMGRLLGKSTMQTDFLIKMSGGNPRWFIHLLNAIDTSNGETINSLAAINVAKQFPDSTLWPYLRKIQANLPSKRRYVDSAISLAQAFVESLREANRSLRRDSIDRPICYVAISMHKTVPFRVHAALRLLQYAGIISSRGPKKITDRDTAEMYLVHPAILVRENALFVGEINPSLEAIVSALNEPLRERFREFTKNSPRLLDFRQDEQPTGVECPKCSFLVAESAKFCSNCGYRIEQPSPLQELRACGVEQLELTQGIKQRVIADGRFSTVGSIIDATDDQLDSIAWIGLSRVALIRYAADEFLAG